MKPDIGECSDEAWRQFVQFTGVIAGEVIENLAAFARDAEDYDALVVGIGGAGEQALIFGSVNEFDNAVVFKPETHGGISNAYGDRFGGSGNLQEELMLLRLESSGKGGTLGEMKKTAQLKAEVSECAEQVRFGGGWGETHIYIVSRHKLRRTLAELFAENKWLSPGVFRREARQSVFHQGAGRYVLRRSMAGRVRILGGSHEGLLRLFLRFWEPRLVTALSRMPV
jgi:hypothetical protein